MKRVMLFLAAVCMTAVANAKILRVSNVSGSSAPYSTIAAAHDAASAGDTIMVEASPTNYGDVDLKKNVVLIGPGYWLVQNGIIQEGSSSASIKYLTINVAKTVIKGMRMTYTTTIKAPNVIINRCNTTKIDIRSDNAVISQNYITGSIVGSNANYLQITNNIITHIESNHNYNNIGNINNCYVAYNTFRDGTAKINATNSTIEHNLWKSYVEHGSNNSVSNNYETDIINTQATNDFIDKDYYKLEIPADVINTYGAFAGDSPYVFAGVPSGPVIQDLIVPTTVEMGSKMNVTIKIGMVK